MANTKLSVRPEGAVLVQKSDAEIAHYDAARQAYADGADARTMAEIRLKRDNLLASTDWWGSSDNTMSDAQTTYRQALRDLPANTSDPLNPTWPTKPE